MKFDTEYKLQEFRKSQMDYFDENGKRYTGVGESYSIQETMLELINELENEISQNTAELR